MSNVISLPESLNINGLGQLLESVKGVISNEDKIVLDAQHVTEIDALGVQMILAIEKTSQLNNIEFQLINISPQLQKYLHFTDTVK